jgi:hypothetical protein
MYNFSLNSDKVKDSISANFSCTYSSLFLLVHAVVVVYRQADCFHKNYFLLVLELIRAGSKTTVVLLFRKILMIASTLSGL